MKPITSLLPHQVFVFGSNSTGFSGAGSAGLAIRGVAANTWRSDPWFLKAKDAPVGSPDRIGKWGVFGVARGWSRGREGMSYAIETIVRPGMKRSTPLWSIQQQLVDLVGFCRAHPEWEFLATPVGAGLAGYTSTEMAECFAAAMLEARGKPENLVAPDDLYEGVRWQDT